MEWLIQGGLVFDGETLAENDVYIREGRIAGIGKGLPALGARVVNAGGCVVSPGFTDLHVHLRQPGYEGKETIAGGCAAAAAGGFTTVCAMPNLNPVPDSLENLAQEQKAIEAGACVRVLPYAAITVGQQGTRLAEIEALAPFVAGFTDDGKGVQEAELMREAMRRVQREGGLVAVHCEVEALLAADGVCIQPGSALAQENGWAGFSAESEWKEVERDIELCRATGCRLHICHASVKESFELVRRAKAEGLPVSCEAVPHNLLLSCEQVKDHGRFRMNPPLRTPEDVQAAQHAVADGTIDAIATDHAPHRAEEKNVVFAKSANGVVGMEICFAAAYTGLVETGIIGLSKLLKLLNSGPRAVLREKAGVLEIGKPANLVVLNLAQEKTVDASVFRGKGCATPFEGSRMKGWPVLTLFDGRVVYEAL